MESLKSLILALAINMKIVKVPFSSGSLGKNEGCEKAPDLVVERLKKYELNEEGKPIVFEAKEVKIDKSNFDFTFENIEREEGDIFIGGDHSITYSCFKIMKGDNKGIIIFDAHPDLEVGTKTVDHESYLRRLIEERSVKRENVVLIGIRNWSRNELDFIQKNRIKCISMKKIMENGIKETAEDIMEIALGFSDLYLSIDIDVLDPAFAPGTGYKEAGGLSMRELLFFLQRISRMRNLKRIDLVEINPDEMTLDCGAKILSLFF